MQTFYVDIYFLINLTVDILALHFASLLSKVPISRPRLIVASALLSILACLKALYFDSSLIVGVISTALCSLIITLKLKGISIKRRVRLVFIFIIINFLIGGIVSFLYSELKKIIKPDMLGEGVNRALLYFAIAILFMYGIVRLFISLFSSRLSERAATIRIELIDKSIKLECLVDSGNLIVDPIDSTPVVLVKEAKWRELIGDGQIDSLDIDSELKKYIRIIPIRRDSGMEICYGVRVDNAFVKHNKKEERVRLTFVMDKYEGSFGGYFGLLPASVLEGL